MEYQQGNRPGAFPNKLNASKQSSPIEVMDEALYFIRNIIVW